MSDGERTMEPKTESTSKSNQNLGEKPWFRKRSDSLGEIQIFTKSRKTERSPTAKRKERDEQNTDMHLLIDLMKSMERNIQQDVKKGKEELKSLIEENSREMKESMVEIRGEIALIKEKQDKWEQDKKNLLSHVKKQDEEQNMLKEKILEVENRLSKLETDHNNRSEPKENLLWKTEKSEQEERIKILEIYQERKEKAQKRDNIIIKGKTFEKSNTTESVRKFIKEKIDIDLHILETKTIKVGAAEHTVVKLGSLEQKIQVLKAKSKLKNEIEKIFIENDLTFQERKIQREIKNFAKQHTGKEVKIGYQKVRIENTLYKWDYKNSSLIEAPKESKN